MWVSWGSPDVRTEFWPEYLSCRHDLEDVAVDMSIIFKWILKEEVKNVYSCDRGQGPVTRSGKYGNYHIITSILNTAGSLLKSW
jgi:hypothetical protein